MFGIKKLKRDIETLQDKVTVLTDECGKLKSGQNEMARDLRPFMPVFRKERISFTDYEMVPSVIAEHFKMIYEHLKAFPVTRAGLEKQKDSRI